MSAKPDAKTVRYSLGVDRGGLDGKAGDLTAVTLGRENDDGTFTILIATSGEPAEWIVAQMNALAAREVKP
jgi:hypothetical protein